MQQYPILATKLYSPRVRSEWVLRPRLVQRLNASLGPDNTFTRKFTLISAPAGFGKTTLVTEWLEALKEAHPTVYAAWLSLDDADNDPNRFLNYMIAAIEQCKLSDGSFGSEALNLLQSPQVEWKTILISLINELMLSQKQLLFVFDDYHVIQNEEIHNAVSFLIQHQSPHLHLVIISREDPPFQLARMRVRQMMVELRATDLRFTPSEISAFLNQALDITLTQTDIDALEQRTEGWVAGLQLAALSIRNTRDVSGFVRSFTGSHRFVLDYLIEEVLLQQPEDIQMFLLKTSILNRMTGELCDALTQLHDARETLEMLEHANLFIIPLDNERRWYRYHHLFADLLRQRLRQTRPELIPVLHRKASDWYAQNGFTDEVIEHTLRAMDFERAAQLIEEQIDILWERGEWTKLRHWLDDLPKEVLFARPYIHIFLARLQSLSRQLDATERTLQVIEQSIDSISLADSERDRLRGRTAVIWAGYFHFKADIPNFLKYTQHALRDLPPEDVSWRGTAALLLGTAHYYAGNINAAYAARLEALNAFKAVGDRYYILASNMQLAITLRAQGRLRQTVELCEQQWQFANEIGLAEKNMVAHLLTVWGETLAELNDLEGGLARAQQGFNLAEKNGSVSAIGRCFVKLIRILFSMSDLNAAEELIQKMVTVDRKSNLSPWVAAQISTWQARMWLVQGELDAACRWVEDQGMFVNGKPREFGNDKLFALSDYLVFTRILIAQGHLDATQKLLGQLLKIAQETGYTSAEIQIICLQALIYQAQGDTNMGVAVLANALSQAEPGGFIRTFVDEGPLMARLLYEALSRDIHSTYVKRLLAAFPDSPEKEPESREITFDTLIEPLSEREIEVLQLIAEGLTNPEIARRMYLSPNTIKAHTRNIYGKLGVNNRTQATNRAKGLGLIS